MFKLRSKAVFSAPSARHQSVSGSGSPWLSALIFLAPARAGFAAPIAGGVLFTAVDENNNT